MDAQSAQKFDSPFSSQGIQAPNNSPAYGFASGEQLQARVLNRALEAAVPTTSQQANSYGSIQPQQATRARHSTVIPSHRSARSRSTSQNYIDEMNNAFYPDQAHQYIQDNNSRNLNWGQHSGHSQQNRYDQQGAYGQQVGPRHGIAYGHQNNFGQGSEIADEHAHLQQRLYALAQSISSQTGLSAHVVAALTAELRELSRRHIDLRRNFQSEYGLVQLERERLASLMASQQQLIQNTFSERDRACAERDRLQTQFTMIQRRQRETEHRLEELEKKDMATIDFLRKQIRFKDEQINGKRSLWMENQKHRNSGVNQSYEAQDPFATPTSHNIPRKGMGFPHAKKLEESQLTPGHSKSSQFSANLSAGNEKTELTNEFWPYNDQTNIIPASPVETGHSPEGESQALIPFKTEDEIAQEFREDFDATYGLIEEWVQNFAHTVNNDMSYDQKLSHNEDVWPFLLSCTYPNFSEAHEHVILLLRNPATRASLVTRVIIQYLYQSVWKATAFCGFNQKSREKLELVEEQLKTKGLEPAKRAHLVAAQTHIIRGIVENETYLAFRSHSLSMHAKALRTNVGPLLDADVTRADAGRALGVITVSAWELAVKMYTSNYTFLFNFPACGSKFLHPSMECDDPNIEETSLQLHIRQARIKLAIKPVITMRNDRHQTITAKKVQNAHVLIFP